MILDLKHNTLTLKILTMPNGERKHWNYIIKDFESCYPTLKQIKLKIE